MSTQDPANLNTLPEFWQKLVLRKQAYRDARDFYAAIRVLSRIQAAVSEILKPYIQASLLATRDPGTLCEFESQMAGILEGVSTGQTGDLPLLEQKFQSMPPPLDGPEGFLQMVVQMRDWNGDSAIVRTLLLLAHLNRIGGHRTLKQWLERPNIVIGGKSPLNAIAEGNWLDVANLADVMLTGEVWAQPGVEPAHK